MGNPLYFRCYTNSLGYKRGESMVHLGPSCDLKVTYHEIFHMLGAIHTQNRPDRDQFVDINWDNIQVA